MTRPIITIHNVETNEIIEREMNDAEFAQYEIDEAAEATKKAQAEAITNARASAMEKLSALGLTTEEIAALTK